MNLNRNTNVLFLKHIFQDYLDYHIDACDKYFNKCISLNYADYFLSHGQSGLHREIKRIIEEEDIKLVFVGIYWNIFQLSPEFFNSLRKKCRIVFWLFDDETFLHIHTKYFAQTADFIISTDTLGQAYYEALDIPTYRYASFYQKELYRPVPEVEENIDVSFVGAVEKGTRVDYLNHLIDNGIKLECWGIGTKRGKVSFEEMVNIFQRSKISLNFVDMTHFGWICERFPLSPRIKQKKGRQIEVALTNSFCLQEYCPDLKYYFNQDEMAVFKNKEELLEKVKYYLEHEDERKAMAEKAYLRSIKNYEGSVGFPEMFSHLLETLNKNETYRKPEMKLYLDSFYRKQYAAFLWLYTLIFIKHRNFKFAFELLRNLWKIPLITIIRGAFFAMRKKETNDAKNIHKFKEN